MQAFLSGLPAVWDETRFVDGYPGEYAVIARRSGATWYVAGINGTDEAKTITLPVAALSSGIRVTSAFYDSSGKKKQKQSWDIRTANAPLPTAITCQPRGGFVLVAQ